MDLKQLFHAAFEKRRHASANRDPIIRLLMPSIITIMLSVACFMTASWAWFVANQSYDVPSIRSGYIGASSTARSAPVNVTDKNGTLVDVAEAVDHKGQWTFEAEAKEIYTVEMHITGNISGYFRVTVPVEENDGTVHDAVSCPFTLTPGESGADVKFQVCTNTTKPVSIEVSWGEPTGSTKWDVVKSQYESGDQKFGNGTPDPESTVVPTNESDEGTVTGGESQEGGSDDTLANDDPAGSNEGTGTQSAETE